MAGAQRYRELEATGLHGAIAFATQLHDEVAALIAGAAAFRATVSVVPATPNGTLGILRTEGATQVETVARVEGFVPSVGDVVLCVPINGVPVVVNTIPVGAPGPYALDAGLMNPDAGYLTLDPAGQDLCNQTGDTASTSNTGTYVQAMSYAVTLPAGGFFTVGMWFSVAIIRTPTGQANIRGNINGSLGGPRVINPDVAIYTHHPHWHALAGVAGGSSVTMKIEYHGHTGTGVTTSAIEPMIWPRILRTS